MHAHRESPDLLRIELCSHVLGYSHAGRRPHRWGRGVSWPPATCACGAVAPLASARPRRADGHRTPPLTPPSTGPARRGPRRVTPPTRHGPTRHCPRARVLSEARLCHAPILTMIRTACAKVKPPSAPTSAPTRLASSLSRPTLLRATPTPRSDGADVDGAVGPERCSEQARARRNLRSSFVA